MRPYNGKSTSDRRCPIFPPHRMKTMMKRMYWGLILIVLLLGSTTWATSGDYFSSILLGGKLLRFNDKVPVYYYLDVLQEGNWDYRTRDFIKDQVIADAFTEWQNCIGGSIRFKQTSVEKNANIRIHWRNGFDDPNLLGLERPQLVMGGKYLLLADIQITLTENGKMIELPKLKAIALHEIGHALGMHGHSPYTGDIMYPAILPGVSRLSSRDIETMREMYNRDPG